MEQIVVTVTIHNEDADSGVVGCFDLTEHLIAVTLKFKT